MAADNKDPNSKADSDREALFVDRDDESTSPFVDRDVDDFHSISLDTPEDADPGYAAFAEELDDPLADWPSPESALDDLPEIRNRAPAPQDRSAEDEGAVGLGFGARPEYEPAFDDVSGDNEEIEDISPGSSDDLLFADDDSSPDPHVADAVDSDAAPAVDTPAQKSVAEPLATIRSSAPPIDDVPKPPAAGPKDTVEPAPDSEDVVYASASASRDAEEQYFEELHFEDEARDAPDDDFDDEEFVDDFLNDLDPPGAEDEADPEREFEDPLFDESPLLTSAAASTIERANSGDTRIDTTDELPRSDRGAIDTSDDAPERTLPIGMIIVVLIALVFLGIGGYGVVQQRAEMQSEIRELQARLATTVTPEEAEAERELQRQVQLENESLSTELEALNAENSELTRQLEELKALVEEKETAEAASAKAAAEQKAAAQKRAEAAAAQKSAAPTPRSSSGAVAGGWFVNFGSYAERALAERWAAKLSVSDGQVVVQSASASGKTLYRVRVVDLNSQDAAERVATALERQYQLPRLWVGKN